MSLSLPSLLRPYIDLDFTRFGVDSRVTFTRSTTRTYCSGLRTLAIAAIDEWPLEYDFDTGALLGRGVDLVEPCALRNPYVLASINRHREAVFAA